MFKSIALITFFLLCFVVGAQQEASLPADFRQHSLTQYNSSLFNPTFTLDRHSPQSFSIWTRWQWQAIDADPTSLFANYSRFINSKSGFGLGFFQHNTGVFFNTGGVVNYAYELKFNSEMKLALGLNLFGFSQKLANNQAIPDPSILPIPNLLNDFILQAAPGLNFSLKNFSLALGSENIFDYNFGDKVANTAKEDKIYMGMASYDFPVMASDSTAYIRPSVYYRRVPQEDNQIGFNALLSTRKFWAQSGYNSFYGVSAGAGGTFFNRLSLGALVEFEVTSDSGTDPSFEIVASYYLGKPQNRRPIKSNSFRDLEQAMILTEAERAAKIDEEIAKAQQSTENQTESVETSVIPEEETKDMEVSDGSGKRASRKLAAQQKAEAKARRKDSISAAKREQLAMVKAEKEEKERNARIATQEQKMARAVELERLEKARMDEANKLKKAATEAARIKERDSLLAVQQAQKLEEERSAEQLQAQTEAEEPKASNEIVQVQSGEKYLEVVSEGDLEPGFYLIANVFGTKKYFNAFMADLRNKGLNPGSFLRKKNNYNHVYLKRFNTMSEARQARDSKFFGQYSDPTWIFRVVGK